MCSVLVCATLSGCAAGSAPAASCAAPLVRVAPAEARAGDQVVVTVTGLHEGCNDHNGADEERPMLDVPITFLQGDTGRLVGEVSGTGETYAGRASIAVPADAEPGPATVSVAATFTAELIVLP